MAGAIGVLNHESLLRSVRLTSYDPQLVLVSTRNDIDLRAVRHSCHDLLQSVEDMFSVGDPVALIIRCRITSKNIGVGNCTDGEAGYNTVDISHARKGKIKINKYRHKS